MLLSIKFSIKWPNLLHGDRETSIAHRTVTDRNRLAVAKPPCCSNPISSKNTQLNWQIMFKIVFTLVHLVTKSCIVALAISILARFLTFLPIRASFPYPSEPGIYNETSKSIQDNLKRVWSTSSALGCCLTLPNRLASNQQPYRHSRTRNRGKPSRANAQSRAFLDDDAVA